MDEHRPLRTYGRIKARPLKPRQACLLESLLPRLAVPEGGEINVAALFSPSPRVGEGGVEGASAPLSNFRADTPRPAPQGGGELVLEIGFGGGEHLVARAAANPEQRFIGVEPFLNGVASCLRHIEESGAQNVRLHQGDARELITRLPEASLDRVYILFPDPWPKARHHKRRLIQPDFLSNLARVMKPRAELRFATDWADYASWTLERLTRDRHFGWLAECAGDWRNPWAGHVVTRYEQKQLGDCAPVWLKFVKLAENAIS